jgi:hypothetical protein
VLKTFDSDGDGLVSAKEFRCAAGTRRGAGWTRIGGAWSVCTGLRKGACERRAQGSVRGDGGALDAASAQMSGLG